MLRSRHPTRSVDLVPLAERFGYLRVVRLCMAGIVLAAWPALPDERHVAFGEVALATGAYLLLSFALEGIWRLRRRRGRHVLSAMLIVDGVYLAGATYVMGGVASPLRSLVVVHLIAVALLASFRTGTKLALWHSLLLFLTFYGQELGALDTFGAPRPEFGGPDFRLLGIWVCGFWAVTITTASFAAVNERELRRQRYDLDALARLAYRLEEATDSALVASALVEAVEHDLGFEKVLLFAGSEHELALVEASRGVARGAPSADWYQAALASDRDSLLARTMATRNTLLVERPHPDRDPWLARLLPDARNLVLVPMQAEARPVGVLVVEHGLRRDSRIERRALSMLERFASQSALALVNAQLLAELERSAATDGLTGLANRTSFEVALARDLARAERKDTSVSLVLLDLDHFKRLNDRHGHPAGDEALRRVAALLDERCRVSDLVARLGGEEFGIVMPGLDGEGALLAAERLRAALGSLSGDVKLTASFGVATYPHDGVSPQALVGAADRALYKSKNAGRNRTTAASALVPGDGTTWKDGTAA